MDLGHSLVSQTSPLYQTYCWYVESVVFSATEIISNGRDRASDPQNWTAFFSFTIIFAFVTSDNWQGRSSYSRRLSFEPRLSCERTVCRPDPTSEYVCFLRGSLHCELARRSAKIEQEAQLSPRDHAMRRVSWNLANYQATVQKIPVRQVLNKSKLWSWGVKVGRCVINMCTQPWRDRVASIVLWVS